MEALTYSQQVLAVCVLTVVFMAACGVVAALCCGIACLFDWI